MKPEALQQYLDNTRASFLTNADARMGKNDHVQTTGDIRQNTYDDTKLRPPETSISPFDPIAQEMAQERKATRKAQILEYASKLKPDPDLVHPLLRENRRSNPEAIPSSLKETEPGIKRKPLPASNIVQSLGIKRKAVAERPNVLTSETKNLSQYPVIERKPVAKAGTNMLKSNKIPLGQAPPPKRQRPERFRQQPEKPVPTELHEPIK